MGIRTDLALEAAANLRAEAEGGYFQGVELEKDDSYPGLTVNRVHITSPQGARAVGKPEGHYITIESPGLTGKDAAAAEHTAKALAAELGRLMPAKPDQQRPILVVGLGNRAVTPDSLGPRVVARLLVTRHILALVPDQLDSRSANVAAIAPGVLGETGMESEEVILALVKRIQPCMVVAIDSLAAMSAGRIATTVQLADTGISPGAGIGNRRPRLDEKSLG